MQQRLFGNEGLQLEGIATCYLLLLHGFAIHVSILSSKLAELHRLQSWPFAAEDRPLLGIVGLAAEAAGERRSTVGAL